MTTLLLQYYNVPGSICMYRYLPSQRRNSTGTRLCSYDTFPMFHFYLLLHTR